MRVLRAGCVAVCSRSATSVHHVEESWICLQNSRTLCVSAIPIRPARPARPALDANHSDSESSVGNEGLVGLMQVLDSERPGGEGETGLCENISMGIGSLGDHLGRPMRSL